MVKLIQKEDKNYYQCEECSYIYETEELAQKCENWCKEYKSCNLEIIKYSIKESENTNFSSYKSNFIFNLLVVFLIGGGVVYFLSNLSIGQKINTQSTTNNDLVQQIVAQVLPSKGFKTNLVFGDVARRMIDCGVIDLEKMKKLYNGEIPEYIQKAIKGSNEKIIINNETANYLLTLFWPLGLSNKTGFNKKIPFSKKDLPYLASTGGWWLGKKDNGAEYFNKCKIIKLTKEKEDIVYEVAQNTFRPCCNNSTFAQDCNHGSALLGALELAASQGYSKDELYKLALQLNSFWFPDNYVKIALVKKLTENIDWPISISSQNNLTNESRIEFTNDSRDEFESNSRDDFTNKSQIEFVNNSRNKFVSNSRDSSQEFALIKEIMSKKYSSISGYLQNVEKKLAQLNLPGIQTQSAGCGL